MLRLSRVIYVQMDLLGKGNVGITASSIAGVSDSQLMSYRCQEVTDKKDVVFDNDDGLPFSFNKMHEFSTLDGFVEVTESLGEMIKYLANEPSVGLYYVQQHTQTAVPNLINLKNKVAEKSRDMSLHTEDSEDSIAVVRSMKDCGVSIADDMINDITKSLAIIFTKQPKKGLISSPSLVFQTGSTSSWGPSSWKRSDDESTSSYFSTVFKSAKEKASSFKWAQLDTIRSNNAKNEKFLSYPKPPLELSDASTSATTMERQSDQLPIPITGADEIQEEEMQVIRRSSTDKLLPLSEEFDEFKADREAKLEEWLGGTDNQDRRYEGGTEAEVLKADQT